MSSYGGTTGYTASIDDRSITNGKDFLKLCIRAFGVCIDQREDSLKTPLVTEFKPDEYYTRQKDEAVNRYENLKNTSIEDYYIRKIEQIKQSKEDNIKKYENKKLERQLYLKIKSEVESWVPPTEEYEAIKQFALEQISAGIPTEEEIMEYKLKAESDLNYTMDKACQDYEIELSDLKDDIEYYEKKCREEVERCNSRNEFMKQFLDSLEEIKCE